MGAAFIIEHGKLLLIHNIKHGLRIEPPGGKVQEGETYEEATIREVREELGIEIIIEELFSEHEIETPEGSFHVKLFLADIINGEPQKDLEPGKIGGFTWYDFEDLQKMEKDGTLVPDVCEAIPLLKEKLSP